MGAGPPNGGSTPLTHVVHRCCTLRDTSPGTPVLSRSDQWHLPGSLVPAACAALLPQEVWGAPGPVLCPVLANQEALLGSGHMPDGDPRLCTPHGGVLGGSGDREGCCGNRDTGKEPDIYGAGLSNRHPIAPWRLSAGTNTHCRPRPLLASIYSHKWLLDPSQAHWFDCRPWLLWGCPGRVE